MYVASMPPLPGMSKFLGGKKKRKLKKNKEK